MPSESISTTASKSSRVEIADRDRRPRTSANRSSSSQSSQAVSATICWARISSGVFRDCDAFQFARADGADQGGAFDQLVARGGEEDALGLGADPVAGAADALQGDGDGARRADLADQIDGADIDAEFERSGGDDGAQFAVLQALLRRRGAAVRERLP